MVAGAVGLAQAWGINDTLVGLTIVAVGTSSPELIAAAVAASRNQTDIAVGTEVGSNVFNLLRVLGLTSSIVELPIEVVSNTDLIIVVASSRLIILAYLSGCSNAIRRPHRIVFVLLYIAYLVFIIQRG